MSNIYSTDLSLIDFVLEKQDDLSFGNKDSIMMSEDYCKSDVIDLALRSTGVNFGDDLFESILDDNVKIETPQCLEEVVGCMDEFNDLTALPSSSSDSGLSSNDLSFDQQLSPLLLPGEEDHLYQSVTVSDGGDVSELGSPSSINVTDSSDVDVETDLTPATAPIVKVLDVSNMGEVLVEDNQAIINMKVITSDPISKRSDGAIGKARRVFTGSNRVVQRVPASTGSNPRSILLPVSIKDGSGSGQVRTIKFITSGGSLPANIKALLSGIRSGGKNTGKPLLAGLNCVQAMQSQPVCSASEGDVTPEGGSSGYPRLELSQEEQRLLKKEGITLPKHYPLTKHEERELKRIRRKIRNKISAQDSRKRKKEYVDGLEDRVKRCTDENAVLQRRIKQLQMQNQSLSSQIRRLQGLVGRRRRASGEPTEGGSLGSASSTSSSSATLTPSALAAKNAQPLTCLMVLLLSVALILVPNLRPTEEKGSDTNSLSLPNFKLPPVAGRSRTLLYKQSPIDDISSLSVEDEAVEADVNMSVSEEEELLRLLEQDEEMNSDHWGSPNKFSAPIQKSHWDHDYGPPSKSPRMADPDLPVPSPNQFHSSSSPDDDEWPSGSMTSMLSLDNGEEIIPLEARNNRSSDETARSVVLQVQGGL